MLSQKKKALTDRGSGCESWHRSWTHWIAHSLWKFCLQAKESHTNVPFQRLRKTMYEQFLWIHQKMLLFLKCEKKCMIRLTSKGNLTALFCNYTIKFEEKRQKMRNLILLSVLLFNWKPIMNINWPQVPLHKLCEQIHSPQFIYSKSCKSIQTDSLPVGIC